MSCISSFGVLVLTDSDKWNIGREADIVGDSVRNN